MYKRFSDEQLICILHEAQAGVSTRELYYKHAISASFDT
ncbi:ORF1 ISSen4 [Klebsiella pneumoniae]|nr:ORF1 ISSen4 [Klebsiella pneumoniae]